jgi:hypothetical protein
MGGVFSGRWTRDTCKSTVESRNGISVQFLKKQVGLREGNNGTLSWSRDGESRGSISYLVTYSLIITVVVQNRIKGKM